MLTTIKLAQLVLQAGFPPGVFNVVTGLGPTVGAALVKHPLVDKVLHFLMCKHLYLAPPCLYPKICVGN